MNETYIGIKLIPKFHRIPPIRVQVIIDMIVWLMGTSTDAKEVPRTD